MLLDYAAWADANGTSIAAFEATSIDISTLETIALHQGTELRGGEILLIRTGWVRAYNGVPAKEQQRLADMDDPPAIGIESSERTLRWLWDRSLAAIVGDQPSMEAWPCQDKRFWLHEWLLAGWGMPIGEMFDLEALSEECRKRQRWSFFFSSMPLNVSDRPSSLNSERREGLIWRRCPVAWPALPTVWRYFRGGLMSSTPFLDRGIYYPSDCSTSIFRINILCLTSRSYVGLEYFDVFLLCHQVHRVAHI